MTKELARRYLLDVSTDATNWVRLKGINDLNPAINPTLVSADDYDTDGWSKFEKTMQGWVVTAKVSRDSTASVLDAGQELVRSRQLGFGDTGRIYVRWYDRTGRPEAYQGLAVVGWAPSKTGVADLEEVTITLTGDGVLTPIANPWTPGTAPVITGVTAVLTNPAAAGQLVRIFGSGFTGVVATTGVKFAGTNATTFAFISDGLIIAELPAGSAGTTAVVVTNATGASSGFNYTRA